MNSGLFRIGALLAALFSGLSEAQAPLASKNLIAPEVLAADLQAHRKSGPVILFVGFPVLYRGGHIPDAIQAGPCARGEGISALKQAVASLPRDRALVIYCGCCPFGKCPNVRPAYDALRGMGFSRVQVLDLPTNFHTDWVAKNFPVQKG
jgi:thiosulfate/3-mercaptopyruvate sulfurtransferase